ncbi:MAG: prevent-host-death protein [Verrucomicrobiota bacterium]|nr:prevent-host-death protein [Verrucomicrobiota bacterium]
MKTATVADLRNNFRRVSAWIEHGETVKILKRGRAFAQLTAIPVAETGGVLVKPDIMARLNEVWGDRMFSMKEVEAMRAAELEGEEG